MKAMIEATVPPLWGGGSVEVKINQELRILDSKFLIRAILIAFLGVSQCTEAFAAVPCLNDPKFTEQDTSRFHERIRRCTEEIHSNPKSGDAYLRRGDAYGGLGNFKAAIQDFTKAIELMSDNANAWVNRGSAYGWLGDESNAIRDFSKALEPNPNCRME